MAKKPFHLILSILISICAVNARAEWFCNEAASARYGNTFQVCGIGEDKMEGSARSKAFDSAREEFLKVCNEDQLCKTSRKSMNIKRTECRHMGDNFKCYRMLEYEIVEGTESKEIDEVELQHQLQEKQSQIEELGKKSLELEKLRLANSELEIRKRQLEREKSGDVNQDQTTQIQNQIDQLSVEMENTKLTPIKKRKDRDPNWTIRGVIKVSGKTIDDQSYNLAGYALEAEHRVRSWVGIGLQIEPYSRGEDSSKTAFTSSAWGIGLPIYFDSIYLRPEYISRSTKLAPVAGGDQTLNQTGYGLVLGNDFVRVRDEWNCGLSLSAGYHTYGDSGEANGRAAVSGAIGLTFAW